MVPVRPASSSLPRLFMKKMIFDKLQDSSYSKVMSWFSESLKWFADWAWGSCIFHVMSGHAE